MRKIRIIARAELQNLFYSPIAWILLVLFVVQCSLAFTDAVQIFQQMEKIGKLFPMPPQPVTFTLMTKPSYGTFPQMMDKLYLYLPLLTMGLLSRELSSGTIRLLFSSPVKTSQIVLGKFAAMMVYSLLLVLILALFAAVASLSIQHVDTGLLLSSLLGFLLLLAAYSAIGLFMSCLTSYQVVAALSTLAIFAALHYLGNIGQGIDMVRELTWVLSLGTRTGSFFSGLITSRDVLYFITITVLFLCFSMLRLQASQESRPVLAQVLRYTGLLVAAIVVGYLGSRPALTFYLDATAPKTNTITPATQALIHSADKAPLEIIAYVNLLDNHYNLCSPQARQAYLTFWEPYIRFKSDIRFKYVYYYETPAGTSNMMERNYKGQSLEQVAKEYAKTNHADLKNFLTPDVARKIPGLAEEQGRFVMQLSYRGHSTYLRVFDDMQTWPSEEQISAALKRLLHPESVPRVGFLTSGLERSTTASGDRSYSIISMTKAARFSLVNNGFDVIRIEEGETIPSDLSTLVIADPKETLSSGTMSRVQAYIATGGNLFVTSEPGKQAVLAPLLQPFGVQIRSGILVQENKEEVPDLLTPMLTETMANMSQGAAMMRNNGRPVYMPGAAALSYSGEPDNSSKFSAQPLLALNGQSGWLKMGKLVNDSAKVKFNATAGDVRENYFVPAIALERQVNSKEQRIAVVADADFMSNQMLQQRSTNTFFCLGLFKWFSNGAFPSELSRLENKDLVLTATDNQLSVIKLLFIWILPSLLLAGGSVLLLRRKRK